MGAATDVAPTGLPSGSAAVSDPEPALPATDAYASSTEVLPSRQGRQRSGAVPGLFGPIRLGPVVGVGLPSVFSVGGMIKIAGYFAAGVNLGLIPKVQLSFYGDAVLSYRHYEIYGRIFPLRGGFFLGAGLGYATAKGTITNTFDTSAVGVPGLPTTVQSTSEGSVRAMVLTPQLGYFYTFPVGFSLGLDVGAQIPVAPSKVEFDTQVPRGVPQELVDLYVTPNDQKVRDTLESVGRTTIPTFNVRLGWLF